MGYRSCVAGAIQFKEADQAASYLNAHKLDKHIASSFFIEKSTICFYIDWVKWYEDYPDVKQVIDFFQNSDRADGFIGYEFHRFGEESDDYECDYEYKDSHFDSMITFHRSFEFN